MARGVWAIGVAMLLLAGPATAGRQQTAGTWAFKVGDRILFLFTLDPSPDGVAPTTGVWHRPKRMNFTQDGASGVEMPEIAEPVVITAREHGDLRLVAANPAKPGDTDIFGFDLTGPDEAELTFEEMPLARLVRVALNSGIDPFWARTSTASSAPDDALTDLEMTHIFEADQAVRSGPIAGLDFRAMAKADGDRRAKVREILARGHLRSAADFLHASTVFQHGDKSSDYLLAHTLALIALKKGSAEAAWMAAATLDRYLQAIGQPQIYGTQFRTPNSGPVTQDLYDRAVVSDDLRRMLGVPDQKGQEAQRAKFEAAGRPK